MAQETGVTPSAAESPSAPQPASIPVEPAPVATQRSQPVSQLAETPVTSTPSPRPVVAPRIDPSDAVPQLENVILTASPTERPLFEQPRSLFVLEGHRLEQQLQPTLGETLSNVPGIRSTYFGPGASRPIIRGLDGDRIRILQNGLNTIDASATSFDHAVSMDPMTAQRIEIVRGPATLLYGANAIGGVVNILDNRIPTEQIDVPLRGGIGTRLTSVDEGIARHFLFEGGDNGWNYHVNMFRREAENQRIPGFARSDRLRAQDPLPPGDPEPFGRLPNSFTDSEGATVGTSFVGDAGFFGVAYSGFNSIYGSPAEESVYIDMEQRRWDFRGRLNHPIAGVREIDYKFGISDYQHTEFEDSEVGTGFNNKGYDGRIEIRHERIGMLEGTVGYQTERADFSALGEEAYIPPVLTLSNSAFLFEEMELSPEWKLQGGARYDHISVESEEHPDFGPARRRVFNNVSSSLGVVYLPNDDYAVGLSTSWSERAPNYQQLFAFGPHLATQIFEIGDPGLPVEQALGFDLSLRKRTGFVTGSITPYYSRFTNYVGQFPTGTAVNDPSLPDTVFRNTDAEFFGFEIDTVFHLLGPVTDPQPVTVGSRNQAYPPNGFAEGAEFLDLELKADYVRATDLISGDPLPRISPFYASAALDYRIGDFGTRLEGIFASDQNRVADNELPTDSYFLLNASARHTFRTEGAARTHLYVKGVNLTNEEARLHTSFLKDVAPLPGRGVVIGVKVDF